ncbi:MAG: B12-binding domain-containing radical SAM protein [bacterium]
MSFKVLLVYPNLRGMNMLPPAIGLLSAVLKRSGFEVELFDTTYYEKLDDDHAEADSDQMKVDKLMARPFKMPKEITIIKTNVFEDFDKKVQSFSPDLIALSATEDMFLLGIKLLRKLGPGRPMTILGGVFATFAPRLALSYPEIDIVCKGEGEDALDALCKALSTGKPYEDIPNLWIKQKDGVIKVNPTKMVDMDTNPLIDMSIFEEARFYRPMAGRVWRMFPVETHRGCPYKCTFCNSPSQMELYKREEGRSYLRRKTFENMRHELLFYKYEMKAEYLYFWADTFFSWKHNEFEAFAEMYEEIGLPFWCQTRIETVTYQRFKRLRDIGCARISFGLEHGNEKFRKDVIKRPYTNDLLLEKLRIVNRVGIPFSVNNIIGFPYETRELAFDTIEVNRYIDAADRNAYAFTPFTGTPLRETCNKLGLTKKDDIVHSIFVNGSLLEMPQFPQHEINAVLKTFNMYVNFPKSRWPEIEKAEADTPEGNRVFSELKDEFVERFWNNGNGAGASFEDAALADTMVE